MADQLFAVDIFKNLISEISEAERTWFLDILATYFSAEEVKVRLKGLVSSAENNPVYKEALSSFEKKSESITKRNLSTGAKIKVLIENKKYDEAIKKIKATFDTIFYDRLFLFEQLATAQISGKNIAEGRATIDEAFAKGLRSAVLLNILGLSYLYESNYRDAEEAWKECIKEDPKFVKVYFNLGKLYERKGDMLSAATCYNEAVKVEPDFIVALYPLAVIYHKVKKYEQAIRAYLKCLEINPDLPRCAMNLTILYMEINMFPEAERVLKAYSGKDESYFYYQIKGNYHLRIREFSEAKASYLRSISIDPRKVEVHLSLAVCHSQVGERAEAAKTFIECLRLTNCTHNGAWDALPISLVNVDRGLMRPFLDEIKGICKNDYDFARFEALCDQLVDSGCDIPASYRASFVSTLAPNQSISHLPVYALRNFGRSGTGLFHSLIDGHDQILTTPSIFFSEFFHPENLPYLTQRGRDGICDKIFEKYPVFFDSRRPEPVATIGQTPKFNFGRIEGLTCLGPNKDKYFHIDKATFRYHFDEFNKKFDEITLREIFLSLHYAYDNCIFPGMYEGRKAIFYHIHNPTRLTDLNFNQHMDAKTIVLIREPLRSLESWLSSLFSEEKIDYPSVCSRITGILRHVSTVRYSQFEYVGLRLEDIKNNPDQTLSDVCRYMNVDYRETLTSMSAAGLQWWGDIASPDYSTEGMKPFGKKALNRKLGSILSDEDLRFFEILLSPFKKIHGYDLYYCRPLISKKDRDFVEYKMAGLLDLEKEICKRRGLDHGSMQLDDQYVYLRRLFRKKLNDLSVEANKGNYLGSIYDRL